MKQILLFTLSIFLVLTHFSCRQENNVVNVYSGRHYQSDEILFQKFTEETGIKVNLIKADTDQLIKRLELEGNNSPADLFITADAGRLIQSRELGLLQPFESENIAEIVPGHLRDHNNYWTGFTQRARVIVYHKERVNPANLSTYENLADPEWKGKVLVRTSQNNYNQTLMASIIAHHGTTQAETWAGQLVNNMAQNPTGNDRDQIKAIAAGIGDIAIVNTYYMGLLLNSPNSEERNIAAQMGIFFPNQDDRGAHVNISGMGIPAHAPNKKNAEKLMEFLLKEDSQKYLAQENHEYPVHPEVEWPELLKSWGSFKADTLPLDQLGEHLKEAMLVFNRAGWR